MNGCKIPEPSTPARLILKGPAFSLRETISTPYRRRSMKRYTGVFICIECGEEWELEQASELECEDCGGALRAVGDVEETEDESAEEEDA
jgi:DNA-directed RNA polymerase subunit RPC12/RpoP